MATGGSDGSVGVYEEDDKVDEKLRNKLSKWILYNQLPCLARNLGFSHAEISRIMVQSLTPEEQIFQVGLFYCPHPKDGEGTFFIGVCLATEAALQSQVLSQASGSRSFPGGTPVLTRGWGYRFPFQ